MDGGAWWAAVYGVAQSRTRLKLQQQQQQQPFHLCFIQRLSCVRLLVTPWTAARQASLSFTVSRSLLKLMCIESVMRSNRLILCRPLLLLPSIFPSIRFFSNKSALK